MITKEQTDSILEQTGTKPEDLLAWFTMVYRKRNRLIYRDCPCISHAYMKKYTFYGDSKVGRKIAMKESYVVLVKGPSIFSFWDKCLSDKKFYQKARRQFKRWYGI